MDDRFARMTVRFAHEEDRNAEMFIPMMSGNPFSQEAP
jgi:hypothetical protein